MPSEFQRIPVARFIVLFAMLAVASCGWAKDPPVPLPRAHAHNDYLHDRPLLDALHHGFCSVEADIFLVDGELLVAHTREELDASRTLKDLYLDPLRHRSSRNGGQIYPDHGQFTLLIDIKSEAETTYRALHTMLLKYQDTFSHVRDGKVVPGAVRAIISGNRPWELVAGMSPRMVGIDGRLRDLESDQPVHLVPLISDNWRTHFDYRGEGEISEDERKKLNSIVQATHANGRHIRFWATPDTKAMWRVLDQAGVDLINTDDLSGLQRFLQVKN